MRKPKDRFVIPLSDGFGYDDVVHQAKSRSRLVYMSYRITPEQFSFSPHSGLNDVTVTLVPYVERKDTPLSLPSPEYAFRFVLYVNGKFGSRTILFPHPPVEIEGLGQCLLLRKAERRQKSFSFEQRLFVVPIDWQPSVEDVGNTWIAGIKMKA